MTTTKTIIVCLGSFAVYLSGPTLSFAAKCAGNNINTMLAWEPSEIAKGTTLTTFRHTSVIVNDDRSAPNNLAAGECVGTLLATPDGKTQGGGSCARKDKDGDVLNEEWTLPAGTDFKGPWRNVGGTGKYAAASGSGQWEMVMSQGKMASVRWIGNCP
jgi:hypothetical protein